MNTSRRLHPINEIDEFVARVSAEREADGQAEQINDPTLYRVLDGIMAGHRPSDPKQRAARRRRAVERARARVPYDD